MSGTVGVVAQDSNRYTMFSVCLIQLRHPPNTRIDWGISQNIASARNTLVQRSLEVGSEWLLFLDDDQVFSPELLLNLLAHDVPIVSALYMRRAGDHSPVAYSHRNDNGMYEAVNLAELPGEGLLKVHAVGAGGLLVRSEVFRAISDKPDWFEHGKVGDWDGSEDMIFCEKANQAGFNVYLDLGSPIGHMGSSAVWPSFIDGEWCLGFSVSDSTKLYAPIETHTAGASAAADAVRR